MDTGWRQDTLAARQQAAQAPAPDSPITRAAKARAAAADNWQGFNLGDGIHNAGGLRTTALQRKAATLVKKRAPRPGWFEDKTPAFTRELIRLNKLHSWNDPLSLIAEPAKHAWTPASVA